MLFLKLYVAIHLFFAVDTGRLFNAQDKCASVYDTLVKKNVCIVVDKEPTYSGGPKACEDFIRHNFKYPKGDDFQATFKLEFIIDADGTLIGERIRNKSKIDWTETEKELLKVLHKMPKWIPGECFGKKVPVKVIFPLYF